MVVAAARHRGFGRMASTSNSMPDAVVLGHLFERNAPGGGGTSGRLGEVRLLVPQNPRSRRQGAPLRRAQPWPAMV
jgi:hypothetical protein